MAFDWPLRECQAHTWSTASAEMGGQKDINKYLVTCTPEPTFLTVSPRNHLLRCYLVPYQKAHGQCFEKALEKSVCHS